MGNLSLQATLDHSARSDMQVFALVGPNGGGKSSLLHTIAGLHSAKGAISFAGETWLDSAKNINLPAHQRPVGLVFQDNRLFGHLNVMQNLAFAQKRAKPGSIGVDEVIDRLALSDMLDRPVTHLSGGEQQRVALARALLSQPKLLLLDEPFAALDQAAKRALIPYIKNIPAQLDIAVMIVSHNVEELLQLAAYTYVMHDGAIVTAGATHQILTNAATQGLATRSESGSVLIGKNAGFDPHFLLRFVDVEGNTWKIPYDDTQAVLSEDKDASVQLLVKAKNVAISTSLPEDMSVQNIFPSIIADIRSDGLTPYAEISLLLGTQTLRARITRQALNQLDLSVHQKVFALVKSVSFDQT